MHLEMPQVPKDRIDDFCSTDIFKYMLYICIYFSLIIHYFTDFNYVLTFFTHNFHFTHFILFYCEKFYRVVFFLKISRHSWTKITNSFRIFNTNNIWVNLRAVKKKLAEMKMEIIVNKKVSEIFAGSSALFWNYNDSTGFLFLNFCQISEHFIYLSLLRC